jgi:hypothetical protein
MRPAASGVQAEPAGSKQVSQKPQRHWLAIMLVTVLTCITGGSIAQADGYVIAEPTPSSSIMPDQKAVLIFHDGHEDLVISIGLELRSAQQLSDMAWIIPVPSLPKVQVTDQALFDELDRLSAPEITYKSERRGGFGLGAGAKAPPPSVEVLKRKKVGVYDMAVLAGREGGALLDWLHIEGFALPDGLLPALDAYIADGWTFVAMRIAPDVDQGEVFSAEPVWISFDSGQMVYPMRLTGVRDEPLALRLYILADHRYELGGFAVEFADRLQVDAPDPKMNPILNREFYFTKLFDQDVTPAEMAVDFYPLQAPTDEPYRERVVQTYVSGGPGFGAGEVLFLCAACWLGLILVLILIVIAIWLLRRRQRPARS